MLGFFISADNAAVAYFKLDYACRPMHCSVIYSINFKLQSVRRGEALYFPAAQGNITRILKLDWYTTVF